MTRARGIAGSALLAALLGLAPREAAALDAVVVLKSDDLAVYEEPARIFADSLAWPVVIHSIEGDRERAREVVTRLRFDPPVLVFALGPKAAWIARRELPDTPLVFAMVRNPVRYGVTGPAVAGVTSEIAWETLLSQVRLFLPEARRVGVLLSTQNPVVRDLGQAARATGLDLRVEGVETSRDVRTGCVRLSREVDVLLVVHDPQVLTPENWRFIREQTRAMGVPVVSTSEALVHAGALLSVVPDWQSTGRQAARLARSILDDGARPGDLEPLAPEGMRVVVNGTVFDQLGLRLDPMVLDFADEVVEDTPGR